MTSYMFRKSSVIGNLDAETDTFLDSCFVETDSYKTLLDFNEDNTESFKRIIIGRTGSGKTALLKKLKLDDQIKGKGQIEAETTIFEHIKNSTFIAQLIDQKIDLKVFYKSLWIHVLLVKTIELIYGDKQKNFLDNFIESITKNSKSKNSIENCLSYIESYKENFFNDKVLLEMTEKMNLDINSKLMLPPFEITSKCLEENQVKTQTETNRYVSSKLIKNQKEIVKFLANNSDEKQKKIIISIDDLDQSWLSENQIRYDFINALLDAIKELMQIRAVKIIISIRTDILRGTYENNLRQDEKDESLYLPIEWSRSEIRAVLDKRIAHLIKDQYVKNHIPTFDEIFSFTINGELADEYILNRTMMRPRDAIAFVNLCFGAAEGETSITSNHLMTAEESYYTSRKNALCKEWKSLYSGIEIYVDCLHPLQSQVFKLDTLSAECKKGIETLMINMLKTEDLLVTKVLDGNFEDLLNVWFVIGVVGIKKNNCVIVYSHFEKQKLDITDMDKEFYVHPLFWRKNT